MPTEIKCKSSFGSKEFIQIFCTFQNSNYNILVITTGFLLIGANTSTHKQLILHT